MLSRKPQLLSRYRRQKRYLMLLAALLLVALGVFVAWWLLPGLLLLGWIVHEAWLADHLFYSPHDDYQYRFPPDTPRQQVSLRDGRVQLSEPLAAGETLILEVELRSSGLGRWFDPQILLGDDRQDFERGVTGRRYLNVSGQAAVLARSELLIQGRHCRLPATATLYTLDNPDYAQRRVMVLAPHLTTPSWQRSASTAGRPEVLIVTLTQGEVEAEAYQRFDLDAVQAARLKGRLRSWDSIAVPLWGNVSQQRCVQLGYYCLQLSAMLNDPAETFASRASGESDIRSARRHNPLALPADADGQPSGKNLLGDLVALLERFRPEIVITPHPQLDPHPDHYATTLAIDLAAKLASWQPEIALLYANHLHDNDRWPMGPAGCGITLPPALIPLPADALWSPTLSEAVQLDKAMALAMQHDLQGRLPIKKRLRRRIQQMLTGRSWPPTGENEFFRKAVRRHELFWVRRFDA